MKTICIIPSYNEDKVENIAVNASRFVDKVVVIDDGSRFPVKKSKRYHIIKNIRRKGKGYCLRKGFDYAIKKKYDIVVAIDADGEHNPSDIPIFLKKLKSGDISIGQRTNYRSFQRSLLNKWSSFWVRLIIPSLRDTQCGSVAIKLELLKRLELTSNGFSINLEILLEALKHNAKMEFVSIKGEKERKSYVTAKEYVKINNLFDRWVIENYKYIQITKFKKVLLYISAVVGITFGGIIEWML